MGERACPHGDRFCPCQDGGACHYEAVVIDGRVSPADPCRNPFCPVCEPLDAA